MNSATTDASIPEHAQAVENLELRLREFRRLDEGLVFLGEHHDDKVSVVTLTLHGASGCRAGRRSGNLDGH